HAARAGQQRSGARSEHERRDGRAPPTRWPPDAIFESCHFDLPPSRSRGRRGSQDSTNSSRRPGSAGGLCLSSLVATKRLICQRNSTRAPPAGGNATARASTRERERGVRAIIAAPNGPEVLHGLAASWRRGCVPGL